VTYINGNVYAGPTESAPLDKHAHDGCLPEDQFTVTMLDDFTTGRTDPVTGFRVYDKVPHRHQNWPWHWWPDTMMGPVDALCCYCGRPVGVPPRGNSGQPEPETDAEWLYGNSPGGLRMQAAGALAAEFGTDIDEWLV
jgi:hypothetical protein